MKRAQLDEVFRRKVRLKISSRKRGRFVSALTVNGVPMGEWERFGNKRTALAALFARLRCMPEICIEVRALAKEAR